MRNMLHCSSAESRDFCQISVELMQVLSPLSAHHIADEEETQC
jgi:hypothetical protein